MRQRRAWRSGAQGAVGFSWGPENSEQRRRPLSLRRHTLGPFFACGCGAGATDTFWKREFHSLLAEGSFLPGKVCCVRTCARRGGWARPGGGVWGGRAATRGFPGPGGTQESEERRQMPE